VVSWARFYRIEGVSIQTWFAFLFGSLVRKNPKLSVLNLEKSRMGDHIGSFYWKENHSHQSSYDWNIGLAGLR
jgi:hypothetical protein